MSRAVMGNLSSQELTVLERMDKELTRQSWQRGTCTRERLQKHQEQTTSSVARCQSSMSSSSSIMFHGNLWKYHNV